MGGVLRRDARPRHHGGARPRPLVRRGDPPRGPGSRPRRPARWTSAAGRRSGGLAERAPGSATIASFRWSRFPQHGAHTSGATPPIVRFRTAPTRGDRTSKLEARRTRGEPKCPEAKMLDLTEAQRAAISALGKDEQIIPAPVWLAQRAHVPNDAIERQYAAQDPEGFWREKAKLVDWMRPFEQVIAVRSAEARVVRRREAQRDGELHRPPRLRRPAPQGGADLGRRGRRGAHVHVQPAVPRGEPLRERAQEARRREGRPGRRLHAALPGGRHLDARLRAHRRDPLGGLRRAWAPRRCASRIEDSGAKVVICSDFTYRRGKKLPLKPTVDEAVRDLYSVEHVVVHRRGSRPGDAPFTFESEREHDFYDVQDGARDPLPARADGRGGPALHPLHLRHHRASRRAWSTPRAATSSARPTWRARTTRSREQRHLLVHLRHRLDRRPLVHRLRPALASARPSSAARACPTTRRPTSPGSCASATAST